MAKELTVKAPPANNMKKPEPKPNKTNFLNATGLVDYTERTGATNEMTCGPARAKWLKEVAAPWKAEWEKAELEEIMADWYIKEYGRRQEGYEAAKAQFDELSKAVKDAKVSDAQFETLVFNYKTTLMYYESTLKDGSHPDFAKEAKERAEQASKIALENLPDSKALVGLVLAKRAEKGKK